MPSFLRFCSSVCRGSLAVESKSFRRGQFLCICGQVMLLSALSHPNIIRLVDAFEDRHHLYYVMEKCEGGELFEHIVRRKHFDEHEASRLCRYVSAGGVDPGKNLRGRYEDPLGHDRVLLIRPCVFRSAYPKTLGGLEVKVY